MRSIVWLALISCALSPGAVFAGYDDLRRDLESYRPPLARYRPGLSSFPAKARDDLQPDAEFEAVKTKLEAAAAKWRQSLQAPDPQSSFYRPDPSEQGPSPDPAQALRALGSEFSLENLELLVWQRSPSIQAARKRFLGSVEAFSQVATLDEILLQYSAFTGSLKPGVGTVRGQDPVDKKFPFPGILALKGQIADQQARAAREDLEIARRNVLTDARQTYWKLGFVHAAQQIADTMLGLLDRLESVATARYESGKTSFQDVAKVRIQKSTLKERLVSLREQQHTLETKLLELADLPPLSRIGRPKHRAAPGNRYDLETLYDLASRRRQELRRMRADIARLERMVELVETRILPGFSMNFSTYANTPALQAGSAAEKEGFPVATQSSVGAGLPKTPWYGTNDAYLRQVRLKHQALQSELEQAEADTFYQVRSAWFELDKAQREARLYRDTVVGLSEAALEAATRGYEAGSVTFADMFDSYVLRLDAHLALAQAAAAVGTARAGLEKAVGVSL